MYLMSNVRESVSFGLNFSLLKNNRSNQIREREREKFLSVSSGEENGENSTT